MENWLNINQKRSIEWNLTNAESLLCAFYAQEHPWVRTRILDEENDYICIAITKLIKELPFIGSSKINFSKGLNSLTQKSIFNKIVDEENSKTVFYRLNPLYKDYWAYPNLILASDIETRKLGIANVIEMKQLLSNDNSVIKLKQLLSKYEEVLSNENKVLSNDNLSNKQSNKQSNKHNQYIENDDDSLKIKNNTKENILKTEFDKLFQLFPETVNNTNKNLALAFGSYSRLTQSQRFDLLKAVKNYSNTKQVKDHQQKKTTNFIQSLNSFITKSFTEFIYGLPENYSFVEEFEVPKKSNGAQFETLADYQIIINGVAIPAFEELNKFNLAKRILEEDDFRTNGAETYDDSKIKELFSEKEYEVILTTIGGVDAISRYEAGALAEALLENIEQEK